MPLLYGHDHPLGEHLKFARWRELASQPFQFSLDGRRWIIIQKIPKQRHRCPQSSQPYSHLMHAFGVSPGERRLVVADLLQTIKANHLETVTRCAAGRKVNWIGFDRRTFSTFDELVSTFRFAFERNLCRKRLDKRACDLK